MRHKKPLLYPAPMQARLIANANTDLVKQEVKRVLTVHPRSGRKIIRELTKLFTKCE